MIKNTFCHINGISKEFEKKLWSNNIICWDDFFDDSKLNIFLDVLQISENKLHKIRTELKEHITLLDNNNLGFLNLPSNQNWRVWNKLKNSCCYIDIETTGLCKIRNYITTIGLYDGVNSRVFVRGKDLDEFKTEIQKYDLIVTFNGACFDLPFLEKTMGISFENKIHIDLRFVLKNLGYCGGLKLIEKKLGLSRDSDMEGVDGFEAVILWYKYKNGDISALNKLIKYNEYDVVNLLPLMEFAYNKSKEKEFLNYL